MNKPKLLLAAVIASMSLTFTMCNKPNQDARPQSANMKTLSASVTTNMPTVYQGMLYFQNQSEAQDYYQALSDLVNQQEDMDAYLQDIENQLGYASLRQEFSQGEIFNRPVTSENIIVGDCYVTDNVRASIINKSGEVRVGDVIYCYLAPDLVIQYPYNIDSGLIQGIRGRDVHDLDHINLMEWIKTADITVAYSNTKGFSYKNSAINSGGKIVKLTDSTYKIDTDYGLTWSFNNVNCQIYEKNFMYTFRVYYDIYESSDATFDPMWDQKIGSSNDLYTPDNVVFHFGDGVTHTINNTNVGIYSYSYSSLGTFNANVVVNYTDWSGTAKSETTSNQTIIVNSACSDQEVNRGQWSFNSHNVALKSELWYNHDVFGIHFVAKSTRYEWVNNNWEKRKGSVGVTIYPKFRDNNCQITGSLNPETDNKSNVKDVRAARSLMFNYHRYDLANGDIYSDHFAWNGSNNVQVTDNLVLNPCP